MYTNSALAFNLVVFLLSLGTSLFYYTNLIDFSSYNVMVLIISLLVLLRTSHIPLLQIILCFCTLFPFYCLSYSLFGLSISDYIVYQGENYFSLFLLVHVLFFCGVSLSTSNSGEMIYVSKFFPRFSNRIAFSLSSILILFGSLSFRGENIFKSANPYLAYVNNLSVESGLPEYLLIVAILLFVFKPQGRLFDIVLISSLVIYAFKLITLGYRVQFLMLSLLVFSLKFEFYLKRHVAILIFFLGFFIFSVLGYVKDGGVENLLIENILFDTKSGFVLSHHTGVIYSSLAIIGALEEGIISIFDRFYSILGILLNSLIPSGIVNGIVPQSNMSIYVKNFTDTAGGVYAPIVFHVSMLPYLAPVVFGFFLGYIFQYKGRHLNYGFNISTMNALYVIAIFSTFPRWVSYDVGNFLFRLPFYLLLIISFYMLVVKLLK